MDSIRRHHPGKTLHVPADGRWSYQAQAADALSCGSQCLVLVLVLPLLLLLRLGPLQHAGPPAAARLQCSFVGSAPSPAESRHPAAGEGAWGRQVGH